MDNIEHLQIELKQLMNERACITKAPVKNNLFSTWKRDQLRLPGINQRISDIRYQLLESDDTYSSEYFCHTTDEI